MNYKDLIERLNNAAGGPAGRKMCQDAAKAITDLLIRAEKAEREKDKLFQILNDVCRDVRAKSADKYVCGLCEYDVAYIGESGDWVNECPGFEKDDCFCMKKSMRYKFGQKEE